MEQDERTPTIPCPACGEPMQFSGGEQTIDRWAERYACSSCGHQTVRSVGRGSV